LSGSNTNQVYLAYRYLLENDIEKSVMVEEVC